MKREDKFYQMCTELPLPEEKDERDEGTVPELAEVARLRDSGNFQAAVDYGRALIKMFPDFDLVYYITAYIYYQKEYPIEARTVALEGIPQCKRHYRLYAVTGLAEFDLDRLPEALVWWCRSLVAQCEVVEYQDHDPFLHLAHAAEIVGAKREAQTLFQMTDAIETGGYRLTDDALERLGVLRRSWARDPFKQAIQQIERGLHR